MKLKNTTAHLISANVKKGKKVERVDFMPAGSAVEVDDQAIENPYIKLLIKQKDLELVESAEPESARRRSRAL